MTHVGIRSTATLLVLAVALGGCGSEQIVSAGSGTAPLVVSGIVASGGTSATQPLAGATVSVYRASEAPPVTAGQTTSDAAGRFSVEIAQPSSEGVYYATASLSDGVELAAILGSSIPSFVTINELTTVAAAYSMARFFQGEHIQGKLQALQIAAGMNGNLVSVATGESSAVLLASPNADETNSLRSTRALANLVGSCVRNPSTACPALFDLTTSPEGGRPTTAVQALVNLAHHPAQEVAALYAQSKQLELFLPSLEAMPQAWTLTVKVNDSGDDGFPFGGPGNIAFDANGLAWITNNVVQNTTVSTRAGVIVMRPDGRPADGTGDTPDSPLTSGGLLGPGFGIDIDPSGSVWVGNFGWGGLDPTPDGNGSVSQFTAQGAPISPADAYQGGPVRAQGTVSDQQGNIWIASSGTDEVYVFPAGDPTHSFSYPLPKGSSPFHIAIASDGTAWVSCSGNEGPGTRVSHFRITGSALELLSETPAGDTLKGLAIDSLGNVWVASGGDSRVYAVAPDGTLLGGFGGGGVDGPWSVSVDGDDNIWVANFGPIRPGSVFTTANISHLAGANAATRPVGLGLGDPISPPSGYTVPSAGSPVLLHDGTPLYGSGSEPDFNPLMRLTAAHIDAAGNVWATNNWKPDFDVDATQNPGGDGIVIFVGIAEPPR